MFAVKSKYNFDEAKPIPSGIQWEKNYSSSSGYDGQGGMTSLLEHASIRALRYSASGVLKLSSSSIKKIKESR